MSSHGAPALLTPAELKALRPVTPRAGGYVTLWGRQVPAGPLSVEVYKRFIVARFEAPRAFFSLGAQVAIAHQGIEEAEAEGRVPDPALMQVVDGKGYTDAQATDGGAANMAFIAAGIGAPGDEEIERQLLDASDDELEKALTDIEFWTWGDDPARFLGRVGEGLAGRALTAMQRAKATTAPETTPASSSRTTSTTRTGSKATTNRKGRRQTKARTRTRT